MAGIRSSILFKRSLLCVLVSLFWFAQYIYMPFQTPFLLTLSITASFAGVIIGAYGFTQLALRIPVGILGDLIKNHKLIIMAGLFFSGSASIIRFLTPTPVALLIANGISGIASAMWVSFPILNSAYYDSSENMKAMSVISVFNFTGILVAYILGGILFDIYGIPATFVASFAAGMLGVILSFFIVPEPVSKTNVNFVTLLKIMKDKKLWYISILGSVIMFIVFATVFSFTMSTAKTLGATGLQLSISSVSFSAASVAGSYFVGTKMAGRLGIKKLITLSFFMFIIYCVGMAFVTVVGIIYPLQFICGLANGIMVAALMAEVVNNVDSEKRSTAMGFYLSIYCVGMTIGPMIMGIFVQHTTKITSFLFMAAIALLSIIISLWIFKFSSLYRTDDKRHKQP